MKKKRKKGKSRKTSPPDDPEMRLDFCSFNVCLSKWWLQSWSARSGRNPVKHKVRLVKIHWGKMGTPQYLLWAVLHCLLQHYGSQTVPCWKAPEMSLGDALGVFDALWALLRHEAASHVSAVEPAMLSERGWAFSGLRVNVNILYECDLPQGEVRGGHWHDEKRYPTSQDLLLVSHFPYPAQTPEPLLASVDPSVLSRPEALPLRAQNLPSCPSGIANLAPAKFPATSTNGQIVEPLTVNFSVTHKRQVLNVWEWQITRICFSDSLYIVYFGLLMLSKHQISAFWA